MSYYSMYIISSRSFLFLYMFIIPVVIVGFWCTKLPINGVVVQ